MENLSGNNNVFLAARKHMVREQLSGLPPRVLAAMSEVPRQVFVPAEHQALAYADTALPIGYGQTISQPYIVALMTAQLDPPPAGRVLEIGTGCGYQTAVLAQLVVEIFTIEIVEPLAQRAAATLARLGFNNVHLRIGDGYSGWPEAAPFDGIIVACAPDHLPSPLIGQLKENGRMVIPIGPAGCQEMIVFQKRGSELMQLGMSPVRFVPMTGVAGQSGRFN